MKLPILRIAALFMLLLTGGTASAQRRGRPVAPPSDLPKWTNAQGFEKDVFTFVRIHYTSRGEREWGGLGDGGGRRWSTDFPDADYNLAFRLQQMTSLKVNPEGRILTIMEPELYRYPFIYIVEPGRLEFSDEEVPRLRGYLLNGGFLMCDDFWGEDEWGNLEDELKRVFPDRPIVELPRTHPIFHCVFDLPNDLNLQVPGIRFGIQSQYNGGITWEREDAKEAHFRGIFDDKGRLCVIICQNTDNGDGWEREGESEFYFKEFSEKKSYPLGINIIFYSMTH